MLSLIPVIYNSLGQNNSKELELWPNNEYEIRHSFQKISSGPTDSDYKFRDGSIEWGLAGDGSGEWKWHSPWRGVITNTPKPRSGVRSPQ